MTTGGCAGGSLFLATCGIVIVAIEADCTPATEPKRSVGSFLGITEQFALKMSAAFAIARALEFAFELAKATFVLFHINLTHPGPAGSLPATIPSIFRDRKRPEHRIVSDPEFRPYRYQLPNPQVFFLVSSSNLSTAFSSSSLRMFL